MNCNLEHEWDRDDTAHLGIPMRPIAIDSRRLAVLCQAREELTIKNMVRACVSAIGS
jgi:hypothetical protein